jgi:hypothetical protein
LDIGFLKNVKKLLVNAHPLFGKKIDITWMSQLFGFVETVNLVFRN